MKAILLALAVVLLVSEVHGYFGGRGEGGWGRPPFGRPPHRGGPHSMFPECKDFVKEVHDKLRETGSGPGGCRTAPNEDECKYQELMQARMQVTTKPSKECLEQVNNFLSGTQTSGDNSSDGSSSQ